MKTHSALFIKYNADGQYTEKGMTSNCIVVYCFFVYKESRLLFLSKINSNATPSVREEREREATHYVEDTLANAIMKERCNKRKTAAKWKVLQRPISDASEFMPNELFVDFDNTATIHSTLDDAHDVVAYTRRSFLPQFTAVHWWSKRTMRVGRPNGRERIRRPRGFLSSQRHFIYTCVYISILSSCVDCRALFLFDLQKGLASE